MLFKNINPEVVTKALKLTAWEMVVEKVYNDNPIPLNGPFDYHDF